MKKLLLIEDDKIVSTIYSNKFRTEGYQVEAVADGPTGLKTVHEFQPDAVILDLMGPQLNGVEVIKQIRGLASTKLLPIIVFSNAYMPQMVQDAWKAGANACLVKSSTTAKHLAETVAKVIAESEAKTKAESVSAQPAPSNLQPEPVAAGRRPKGIPMPSYTPSFDPEIDPDIEFQADLRKTFLDSLPQTMATIRLQLQALTKTDDLLQRTGIIFELYRKIHSLTSNSAMTGLKLVARISSALEAFMQELHKKPDHVNASVSRTIAQTVDLLGNLLKEGENAPNPRLDNATLLVVDDDLISRRAVVFALEKVEFKPISLDDPFAALKMLEENTFDIVFLDIDMPGMSGLELCQKIKMLPKHKTTPVIFISSMTDFQSRAQTALSGGADLIGKPFLFLELALKALLNIVKARLANPAPAK
ncbi:MAG: response regulator [Verrucomicrobiales bacterium]